MGLEPEITYANDHAISTFTPEKRGCYAQGEVNLTYVKYSRGYRYEMKNCLSNELIRDIIWNCRCYPRFYQPCKTCYLKNFIPSCSGKKLICANAWENGENITVPEALENPNKIGNLTKPSKMKCLWCT